MGRRRSHSRWVAVLGLVGFSACMGDFLATPEGECPLGIGLGAPPCDCNSWTWQLRPFPLGYEDLPELTPDRAVSPPVAEISVGQRFQVVLGIVQEHPEGCNQGYGSGTVQSTNPAVVAFVERASWPVFAGVAPGTATLEAVDLRTPSGGRTSAPLTVCRDPSGPNDCLDRVPLVIEVVPNE